MKEEKKWEGHDVTLPVCDCVDGDQGVIEGGEAGCTFQGGGEQGKRAIAAQKMPSRAMTEPCCATRCLSWKTSSGVKWSTVESTEIKGCKERERESEEIGG